MKYHLMKNHEIIFTGTLWQCWGMLIQLAGHILTLEEAVRNGWSIEHLPR